MLLSSVLLAGPHWWDTPMRDLLPWWAWPFALYYLIGLMLVWLTLLDARCLHHWHAADAMIRWSCCWCGTDTDGWPKNRTTICNHPFRHTNTDDA